MGWEKDSKLLETADPVELDVKLRVRLIVAIPGPAECAVEAGEGRSWLRTLPAVSAKRNTISFTTLNAVRLHQVSMAARLPSSKLGRTRLEAQLGRS